MRLVSKFVKSESGASMIEYGLLAALISVVAVTAITQVGLKVNNTFVAVNDAL